MAVDKVTERAPLVVDDVAGYLHVRRLTERMIEPLAIEDYVAQSMADASPIRWHLAHTTWFFETFLLRNQPWYQPLDDRFEGLFNSYYNGVGEPLPRQLRGLITRPTVAEVKAYRQHVDAAMIRALGESSLSADVVRIGINHEQQHQELMLTDLKHLFYCNPLLPIYQHRSWPCCTKPSMNWTRVDGGIVEIGHDPAAHPKCFAYDNESPRHRVIVPKFELANDLVTNGRWMEFIAAGGYDDPACWLSLGWSWVRSEGISAPLYWRCTGESNCKNDSGWYHFTLAGEVPVDPDAMVTHISYFEADAFARWAGARLPTEAEWEAVAAAHRVQDGNSLDEHLDRDWPIHPLGSARGDSAQFSATPHDLFGAVWQWTSSPYVPYPGYRPAPGTLGEYNGKFMSQQYVLRGGSCATPRGHVRATYRNFFSPESRWQFTGLRLARDVDSMVG